MKIIAFVIALALFLFGMALMGYAFEPDAPHGILFFSGILSVALSLAIPFHVLKRVDG
ncbi:MAG: hypothetical protein V4531_01180 [Actinomycetota bacterium]